MSSTQSCKNSRKEYRLEVSNLFTSKINCGYSHIKPFQTRFLDIHIGEKFGQANHIIISLAVLDTFVFRGTFIFAYVSMLTVSIVPKVCIDKISSKFRWSCYSNPFWILFRVKWVMIKAVLDLVHLCKDLAIERVYFSTYYSFACHIFVH